MSKDSFATLQLEGYYCYDYLLLYENYDDIAYMKNPVHDVADELYRYHGKKILITVDVLED